jgi:hypothetical protein
MSAPQAATEEMAAALVSGLIVVDYEITDEQAAAIKFQFSAVEDGRDVRLTPQEARAFALLLIIRRVRDTEWWLEWEDLPNLDELSMDILAEAAWHIAAQLDRRLTAVELLHDIDSRDLLKRGTL